MLGLATKRIQFTPDLMPADIVGSEVLDEAEAGRRSFASSRARSSPAPDGRRNQPREPRTQSALLQAMQEHHVTVAGTRYDLPHPFHVWRPRTRWNRKAPILFPKRSSTAS